MFETSGWSVSAADAGKKLSRVSPRDLFPSSGAPDALLAGLLLYLGCWEEAHTIAQDIPTVEGSYWHAIIHRMEPDAGNSGYWFRRVGRHAIFPDLRAQAIAIAAKRPEAGYSALGDWDPFCFIDFCEQANAHPGSEREQAALEIQQVEWELLMRWCHG